ncbi:hypothetical protein LUZ63_012896 [Rhynchospora breviuscula]|uniref:Uncharacterized protein n=1 Tax=Rhynchospora breviuscula TaxID=2022672 RepID=A0A9Q0C7I8_9POAL|nr:hypothetical protein LUZ63_012896 [Rhynchospora breviuscula]
MATSVETSSYTETSSTRLVEKFIGSHQFKITGYSIDKAKGVGYSITSATFKVGGYEWDICFYPAGDNEEANGFVSLYLDLLSKVTDVKAQFSLTILDKHGRNALLSRPSKLCSFDGGKRNSSWGYGRFIEKTKLESYLKDDDCFTIKCTVAVHKVSQLGVMDTAHFAVPPSDLHQQFASFFESGDGVDVTFKVNGQTFGAHRSILAARSPIFNAQFCGPLKEMADKIKIEGIEAPVFAALLQFVYSDSCPDIEEDNQGVTDNPRQKVILAEHLLVAADRYGLERLKLMCEKVLGQNIDITNMVSYLTLAECHNCTKLKDACLKFIARSYNS